MNRYDGYDFSINYQVSHHIWVLKIPRNFNEFKKKVLLNICIQFKFIIINICHGYLYNPLSIIDFSNTIKLLPK
jgi:hypothetical protein